MVEEIKSYGSRIQQVLTELRTAAFILIEGISATVAASKRLDEAGWLPHITTPLSALRNPEIAALSRAIEKHYRDNWSEVKAQFIDQLHAYTIDDEAKATFHEALLTHEQRCYRATVRLLFPEIERVIAVELRNVTRQYRKRKKTKAKDTGRETLLHLAGQLPLGDHGDPLALRLFFKLSDHIYNDRTSAHILSRDPVPNRHAAMHGFVSYSMAQNSINTLIMADYVFRLVTAAKIRMKKR